MLRKLTIDLEHRFERGLQVRYEHVMVQGGHGRIRHTERGELIWLEEYIVCLCITTIFYSYLHYSGWGGGRPCPDAGKAREFESAKE